jgi:hypothetical protein
MEIICVWTDTDLSSILPLTTCFRRQFLSKMDIFLSLTLQYFLISHTVGPNEPSASFSSTTFQNFQGISELLFKMPTFQHQNYTITIKNVFVKDSTCFGALSDHTI